MNTQCPICNAVSNFLGELGDLIWYRCPACGMDHYVIDSPDDPDTYTTIK